MKRFWPLAFLLLLLGALALRPLSKALQPARSLPRPVPLPVATPEPSSPATAAPVAAVPVEHHEETLRRSAVGSALLWLARNQNPDGSWGSEPVTVGGRTIGRTGITALALLSLLGAGYSQLSVDEYDGDKKIGEVVKKGLLWVIEDQRADGTFRSGFDAGFDQALATFALSEAYGMTGSQPLKEPTERAAAAMFRMQDATGSWGGPEQTAWAVQALYSLQLDELSVPWEVGERAKDYVERTSHSSSTLSRILLTKQKNARLTAEAHGLAQMVPQDPAELLHATNGLFQYDGPDGPLWKEWNESMKKALIPTQNRDGSWQGGTPSHTVVRTSLSSLTLEVYYRHANVFTTGK
jgi:hypothetical protein